MSETHGTDALRRELARNMGPCLLSDLRAHIKRDSLFVVADHVDLLSAALALAVDDVAQVQSWLESGALQRPPPDVVADWEASPPLLMSAIVQPWVLVQTAPHEVVPKSQDC